MAKTTSEGRDRSDRLVEPRLVAAAGIVDPVDAFEPWSISTLAGRWMKVASD